MDFKLILGYDCNLKCDYCYQTHTKAEMDYKTLDKFIERFNKLKGVHTINLFGGEPLLYVDKIKYLMDRIDNRHELSISTNGTMRDRFYMLQEKWNKPIANLLSNKVHKNYNKLNDLSYFRFIVTKDNIDELTEDLVKFLGNEYKEKLQFKYTMDRKWEYEDVKKLENVEKQLKHIIGDNYRIDLPVNYNAKFVCFVSDKCCFINYNGEYLGCHRLPNTKLGNIFDDDFIPVHNSYCLDCNTNKVDNLFSYGEYKFKGTSLFHSCD